MSAYMVEDETINALVNWAIQQHGSNAVYYRFGSERHDMRHDYPRAKQVLREQNERSLRARYQQADDMIGEPFQDEAFAVQVPIVSLIKACHCYAYQACETEDWAESEAHAIIEAIEGALVRSLPGYDAAPWGLSADDVDKSAICLSQLISRKPALRSVKP